MKPFRFTLEALITLRQRQEVAALELYAKSLRVSHDLKKQLESVQEEQLATWGESRRRALRQGAASDWVHLNGYNRLLEERKSECAGRLKDSEREAQAALQKVIKARQAREVVEACRDKQKHLYEQNLLREERKLIDDLSSRRSGEWALNNGVTT